MILQISPGVKAIVIACLKYRLLGRTGGAWLMVKRMLREAAKAKRRFKKLQASAAAQDAKTDESGSEASHDEHH